MTQISHVLQGTYRVVRPIFQHISRFTWFATKLSCRKTILISKGLFLLVCEAIGTAATLGPLCQPRMIVKMIVEKQMECRLAGESFRRKPAPAPLFSITKIPHDHTPGLNPGRRGGKSATNRLSYGSA
jgi:hypothetical protein